MDPLEPRCPRCRAPLRADTISETAFVPCAVCKTPLQVHPFPALLSPPASNAPSRDAASGEAGCFFHPAKQAAVTCDVCGRFLCNLCDIPVGAQHLCPTCIDSGQRTGKLRSLDRQRFLYDNLALWLAILPILVWPFTILTAPAAIYVAIRYWKTPISLVPRSKIRFVAALVIAGAQTAGWLVLLGYLILRWLR